MIVFFGPAGAGKSTQGQILADSYNWPWISAGQLLRKKHDDEALKIMQEGKLVPPEEVDQLVGDAIINNPQAGNIILDGFPRQLIQAHWLVENRTLLGRSIDLAIMFDISKPELMKRLRERGRPDDTPEVIDERLRLYDQEINPILDYFAEQGVKIVHIDGAGTIDEVHDKVIKELAACNLI